MRTRPLLSLAVLTLVGCQPSAFESLTGGRSHQGLDASNAELPDAEVDAGDGSDVPEAGLTDGEAHADADAAEQTCPAPPSVPRPLVLAGEPRYIATLKNPPGIGTRTLSATAWLGSDRVWLFSGTVPADPAFVRGEATPGNFPSAATDDGNYPWLPGWTSKAPWSLGDQLDARGLPTPLVDLPGSALPIPVGAYVPSLAPSAAIRNPDGSESGIIFMRRNVALLPATEVWLADIAAGATRAKLREQPLFSGDDPMFAMAAHRGNTYVKLFACKHVEPQPGMHEYPCLLARVPVGRVGERDAYEARVQRATGEWGWDSDLKLATPVLNGDDSEMSVSFNNHLGQYVVVHSTFFSNQIAIHTSPSIDGPWTEEQRVTFPAPKVGWVVTGAREQPGLVQNCGRSLIISHWNPTVIPDGAAYPSAYETVLTALDLQ